MCGMHTPWLRQVYSEMRVHDYMWTFIQCASCALSNEWHVTHATVLKSFVVASYVQTAVWSGTDSKRTDLWTCFPICLSVKQFFNNLSHGPVSKSLALWAFASSSLSDHHVFKVCPVDLFSNILSCGPHLWAICPKHKSSKKLSCHFVFGIFFQWIPFKQCATVCCVITLAKDLSFTHAVKRFVFICKRSVRLACLWRNQSHEQVLPQA